MTIPTAHIAIGKEAAAIVKKELNTALLGTRVKVDLTKLHLRNDIKLHFGEIVALGGDFYGIPTRPISLGNNEKTQTINFDDAYTTLGRWQGTHQHVKELLTLFNQEKSGIEGYINKGKMPHHYNHALFWQAVETYNYGRACANYLDICTSNIDHFGENGRIAYLRGHQLAMRKAANAANQKDDREKTRLLNEAFAIEAFACHFLTDAFSAGHVRTPRFAIYDYYRKVNENTKNVKTVDQSSSFIALKQHDEDGETGLFASIILKDKRVITKLVGDHHFCDDFVRNSTTFPHDSNSGAATLHAALTMEAAVEATAAGIREIIHSYTQKKALTTKMDDYFPREIRAKNPAPLYRVNKDGVLQQREKRVRTPVSLADPTVEIVDGYIDSDQYQYRKFTTLPFGIPDRELPTPTPSLSRRGL